jgi:hypothetical protein
VQDIASQRSDFFSFEVNLAPYILKEHSKQRYYGQSPFLPTEEGAAEKTKQSDIYDTGLIQADVYGGSVVQIARWNVATHEE